MALSEVSDAKFFEASNGLEALNVLENNNISIAILDIDMPVLNGIELAKQIENKYHSTKTIFLTAHTNFFTFADAQDVAYSGFVLKENAMDELLLCVNSVMNDEQYYSTACKIFLAENAMRIAKYNDIKKKLGSLTEGEGRVLLLVAQGKTTPQIAEQLFNSIKTIENHRTNICEKLELKGANNLLLFAIENRDLIELVIKK
jgi:NarL family two-component system response regulator LiaR